jgi:hypothetical protein
MMRLSITLAVTGLLCLSVGCKERLQISRDEIPAIKGALVTIEQVLRSKKAHYLDSLFSSDARDAGTTAGSVMSFVYSARLDSFVGFTQKQIVFRGDAARIDCMISGPSGPVCPVTITMRKEDGYWLLKKIEPQIDSSLIVPPLPDSLQHGADST